MTPGCAGPIPLPAEIVLTDRSLGARLVRRFFGVAAVFALVESGGVTLDPRTSERS